MPVLCRTLSFAYTRDSNTYTTTTPFKLYYSCFEVLVVLDDTLIEVGLPDGELVNVIHTACKRALAPEVFWRGQLLEFRVRIGKWHVFISQL